MLSSALAHSALFEGLDDSALTEISARMRPRHFASSEILCRQGEPGDSLFVILSGLAHVRVSVVREPLARLRRGDVVGEMSLLTGEPRSATVTASVPTEALELSRPDFTFLLAQYPVLLMNLNRILSRRLARTNVHQATARQRGEAIGLLVEPRYSWLVPLVLDATRAAGVAPVAALDADVSMEESLQSLDSLLSDHGTVIVVDSLETSPVLLQNMDRAIAVTDLTGAHKLADITSRMESSASLELVLLHEGPIPVEQNIGRLKVVRRISLDLADAGRETPSGQVSGREVAWLGRHLSRTKLGLALGAGGAKGYAHAAAIGVLEGAGYTVDYVAGTSIGAFVGACHAMGRKAAGIEATMRSSFTPDVVKSWFTLSLAGTSTGVDVMACVCREMTGERTFADLSIPLIAMCVDLNTQQPAPISEGPVWEALLASMSVAGFFPPYLRDGQRLIDGLALVPVPTQSVLHAGADITIAVNIMSRDTLSAWPGEEDEEPAPPRARGRMLDTLLAVMDLAQLDASVRHASLADVVITPRFGPASWRDFHLEDKYLAAGKAAAQAQLPELQKLARPQLQTPDPDWHFRM